MVDAALSRGYKVRVLDNFSSSSPSALAPVKRSIELLRGDVRDARAAAKACAGADAVFHFAAIRSVVKSVEDPFLAHSVNATGALVMLEAAARARVKHFVFTSTSSVYGAADKKPQREGGETRPISPYGIAKLAAEQYANYFWAAETLPTTNARIFNVYGPRQNPESRYSLVVPGVLDRIRKGRRPVIDGTGRQARDFVYIGDVIDALFLMMGNRRAYGKTYNLGSGRATRIDELVRRILKAARSPLKPEYGPKRPGDPDRTCADVRLAAKELGWKPRVGLDQGLKETVRWAMLRKNIS